MTLSRLKSLLTPFDMQGLTFGILLACLSMVLLKSAGLVTGQTAGLALLLSYVLPVGFGPMFFLISFPFFIAGWIKRGTVFAFHTFLAILGISLITPVLDASIHFTYIHPLVAAILGGVCAGMAVIAIFRHNGSAGGMTVLGLLVEERTGIKAGWVQLAIDGVIFLVAAAMMPLVLVLYSFVGAVVMNLMIAWNFQISQSGQSPKMSGEPAQ
ncbi:YitT family protein [Cognatishimia sp. SS12]|uniref:YitT family protein n=1 Tax=Cognatishimia sp. SS12 TaxID=2979465 RepID=UPI00232E543C|nr:YitT family protein [Cognatishimia sp. SS12]MDC0738353.1 YitT family protein [Cognatishimia sp. SS12]